MTYLHTKFHIPSLRGSLLIGAKLKAKEDLWKSAMLLFYILQIHYVVRSCMLCQDLLLYIISVL